MAPALVVVNSYCRTSVSVVIFWEQKNEMGESFVTHQARQQEASQEQPSPPRDDRHLVHEGKMSQLKFL